MIDKLNTDEFKMYFTASDKPKICIKCQWGVVSDFEGFDGKTHYGVSCFIPELESMKGECPKKMTPWKLHIRFYKFQGDRLHSLQLDKRLTMRKLAIACNVSSDLISDIIDGYKAPTPEVLESICRVLELSPRDHELLQLEYKAVDKAIIEKAKELMEVDE